jgi:hypothetical protein
MRIFISHSWEEVNYYEEMVGLIDFVLGSDTWTNMSIPRDKALNVLTAQSLRYEEEARRLEEALWNAEAALRDPSLPDAISLTKWIDGMPVEVPTVGSVRNEIDRIRYELAELGMKAGRDRGVPVDPKGASAHIRAYPELAHAIREKLQTADLVFVLLTRLVRLHQWVDYEVALSAMVDIPIIGVRPESFRETYEDRIDMNEIIDMDEDDVRRVLNAFR